jgi:uncharacterized damage-inducible protein DinB
MEEVERIVEQYDRALHGGAWHGDSVWEILATVSPEQAFRRLSPKAHTVWELVSHMTFWETAVYRRLKKLPPQNKAELNFPAMPEASAEHWERALEGLRRSNEEFRKALLEISESQLDKPLSAPEYTVYVEVNGVIQHHLYHAGQIALLSRILPEK